MSAAAAPATDAPAPAPPSKPRAARTDIFVLGLTGGIASGKSTVAKQLAAPPHGLRVVDADLLGHRTYEPGTATYKAVVAAFGPDVVAADGKIDRKALGGKVFGKPEEMKRLTDAVWPGIRALALAEFDEAASKGEKVVVLEAAVMFEAAWEDLCHAVWVCAVDPDEAVRRAVARQPGLDEEGARRRLASQMGNDERAKKGDHVLWNDGSVEELREKVEEALEETLSGVGWTAGRLDD
ncbi:dephospho-CoA kinase [Hyaloraphidium curvatum]|nr:dephospho-CoA kinase [Hyaloraphidium curvatum]